MALKYQIIFLITFSDTIYSCHYLLLSISGSPQKNLNLKTILLFFKFFATFTYLLNKATKLLLIE